MVCCRTQKEFPEPPRITKYPCKVKIDKPCLNVDLQQLVDIHDEKLEAEREREEELKREREKNKPVEKKPCKDVKPPSTRQFREFIEKKICTLCFPRRWNTEEIPDGEVKEFPKLFEQKGKKYNWKSKCPRELDDYEKNLWIPICKPRKKPEECKEPIDQGVCVFCLEDLYTGGFIHELFEKTPLIKKQSEITGDEIAERIGIRTRIIVHKKCYDSYVEAFTKNKQKDPEIDLDNKIGDDDDDDDLNCGVEEEEEEEEEEEVGEDDEEDEEEGDKKKSKPPGEWKCHYKQHFCLKKFEFPNADSDYRRDIYNDSYIDHSLPWLKYYSERLVLGKTFQNECFFNF